jgi:hypothetical protein
MKIVILLVCSTAVAAQTVEGNLYDSLSGAPVAGAYVSMSGNGSDASRPRTRSDAAGHFSLVAPAVAAGVQTYVSAEHAGYLAAGSRPLGGGSSELRIALTPESFLSGKLVDQDGFPVQGASVMAASYMVTNAGERRLQTRSTRATSDDLGQFRIPGLQAGHYFLLVLPDNLMRWDGRYNHQYVPGGSLPDESHVIDLAAGQERSLGELVVRQVASFKVTGRAALPNGSPSPFSASLHPIDANLIRSSVTVSVADGKISMDHVLPGRYNLVVRTSGNRTRQSGDYEAVTPVEVTSGNIDAGVITLQELRGMDLTGSVTITDGTLPAPAVIRLRSESVDGSASGTSTAKANSDGIFVFKGLLPGHYQFQTPAVRSAKLGDEDVLQAGFDLDGNTKPPLRVRISLQPIVVRIRLVDGNGKPQANAAVEVLRPNSNMSTHTDVDGWFTASFSAPGAYTILVANDGQFDTLYNQDYRYAHFHDFPAVQIVDGMNQPIMLTMPAGQ